MAFLQDSYFSIFHTNYQQVLRKALILSTVFQFVSQNVSDLTLQNSSSLLKGRERITPPGTVPSLKSLLNYTNGTLDVRSRWKMPL